MDDILEDKSKAKSFGAFLAVSAGSQYREARIDEVLVRGNHYTRNKLNAPIGHPPEGDKSKTGEPL